FITQLTTTPSTLSLHDALPIFRVRGAAPPEGVVTVRGAAPRRSLVLAAGCLLSVVGVGAATPASRPPPQGTIVFASDRSGTSHIYSIGADGSRLGQLTRGKAADAAP